MLALGSHLHPSIFFTEASGGEEILFTCHCSTCMLLDEGPLKKCHPLVSFNSSIAIQLLLISPSGSALFRQGHFFFCYLIHFLKMAPQNKLLWVPDIFQI